MKPIKNRIHCAVRRAALGSVVALSAVAAVYAAPTSKADGDEQAWAAASEANVAAGYEAYLSEYPKGRYAATARIKLAILSDGSGNSGKAAPAANPPSAVTPASAKPATATAAGAGPSGNSSASMARPSLPFSISDALWQQIAQSELFKTTPRVHTVAMEYTLQTTMQLTMFNKTTSSVAQKSRISAFSDSYAAMSELNARTTVSGTSSSSRTIAVGILLPLGTIDGDGKLVTQLNKIDKLEGSFYPAHAGATVSVAYESEMSPELKATMHIEASCTLGERLSDNQAAQLAPTLKGNVWPMDCKTHTRVTGPYGSDNSGSGQDYLFEDLGVTASQIGVLDLGKKIWVMPFGQTYHYDWTAGSSKTSSDVIGYRVDVLN